MVILEVIIGIVLIYFLLSLFSSIIAERIAKFIGLRGRILRQGIHHLLNDIESGKKGKWTDFSRWFKDIFAIESADFNFSKAGEFYRFATVKYLSKMGQNKWYSTVDTKPSYISRENFLVTILSMLDRRSTGINEWERVKFAIRNNTAHLEQETLSMFNDWLTKANDDFKVFKSLVLSHFDGQMDRVNGWYKKKIQNIIFFIGIILCLVFNADTFEIFYNLSNNPEKRAEMVNLAISVANSDQVYLDTVQQKNKEPDSIHLKRIEEAYKSTQEALLKSNDILGNAWVFPPSSRIFKEIKEDSASVINAFFKPGFDNSPDNLQAFNKKYNVDFLKVTKIEPLTRQHKYNVYGTLKPNRIEKLGFILSSSLPHRSKFWGFVITALALTLGAQFWFDLLKKLISIRGVGHNPDENRRSDKERSDVLIAKTDGLQSLVDDPVEYALLQNRPYWEKLPGFISANLSVDTTNEEVINLVFEKDKKPASLTSPLKIEMDGKKYEIPIAFAVGELGKLSNDTADLPYPGSVRHQASPKNWGSLAGMVFSPKLGKNVVLSCGHVIRNGKSAFIDTSQNTIEYYDQETNEARTLGKVSNLVMSSFCDAGIINPDKNNGLTNIAKITRVRSLNKSDEFNSQVKIMNYENRLKEKTDRVPGRVLHVGYYRSFGDYPASTKRYYNLFVIKSDKDVELSKAGDSGSLIIDDEDVAVGLLVGGGKIDNVSYSFGIDINDVFDILQVQPCKIN
jgi:hypothetical protein